MRAVRTWLAVSACVIGACGNAPSSSDPQLVVTGEEVDELGMRHVRLVKTVDGIPVIGGEAARHYRPDGSLASADAYLGGVVGAIDTRPVLSATEAIRAAERGDTFARSSLPELRISEHRLVYAFTLESETPGASVECLVDAHTGDVVRRASTLLHATGTGTGLFNDQKPLQIEATTGGFALVDRASSVSAVQTYVTKPGPKFEIVTSTTTAFVDPAPAPNTGEAIDAHFHVGLALRFFKLRYGFAFPAVKTGTLRVWTHYPGQEDNAGWDLTNQLIVIGDARSVVSYAAAFDVIAHEITHAIVGFTSKLTPHNQPGALNEGIADAFGAFAEHAAFPNAQRNWLHGDRVEDITKPTRFVRNLAHPSQSGSMTTISPNVGTPQPMPAHMKEFVTLADTATSDWGGIHVNSSIVSHAAFLMTMGGTNDVSKISVRGIGYDKAEAVWFRAMTKYFLSTTDFAGAARATLSAAVDAKLTDEEKDVVECAWIAVGVLPGPCKTKAATPPPPPPPDVDETPLLDPTSTDPIPAAASPDEETAPTKKPAAPSAEEEEAEEDDDGGRIAPPASTAGCSTSAQASTSAFAAWPLLLVAGASAVRRRRR